MKRATKDWDVVRMTDATVAFSCLRLWFNSISASVSSRSAGWGGDGNICVPTAFKFFLSPGFAYFGHLDDFAPASVSSSLRAGRRSAYPDCLTFVTIFLVGERCICDEGRGPSLRLAEPMVNQ